MKHDLACLFQKASAAGIAAVERQGWQLACVFLKEIPSRATSVPNFPEIEGDPASSGG